MNTWIAWPLLVFLTLVWQCTGAHFLSFYGVKPDFALIFVIYAGTVAGKKEGLAIGFFLGLALDLCNSGIFGFNVLVLSLAGVFTGIMRNKVFRSNRLLPLTLVLSFGAGKEVLWFFAVLLFGYPLTQPVLFVSRQVACVAYELLLTLPLFFLLERARCFFNR